MGKKYVRMFLVFVSIAYLVVLPVGCSKVKNMKVEEFLEKLFTIDEIIPFIPTETAIESRYAFAKEAMTERAYFVALKNRTLTIAWAYSTNANCILKVVDITEVEPVYGGGTKRYTVTITGGIETIVIIVDLRFDDDGKIEYFEPDRALYSN